MTQMITASLGGRQRRHDDARRGEEGGRRVQQDRARLPPRPAFSRACTTRASSSRWWTASATYDIAVRPARSEAGEVPVPDVDDHGGSGRRRVLHEVSRPLHLDAPAGRRHERAGPASATSRSERCRRAADAAAGAAAARRVGRQGQHRLGEDVQGGEDRRRQELLRRAELGADEGERRVSEDLEGVGRGSLELQTSVRARMTRN